MGCTTSNQEEAFDQDKRPNILSSKKNSDLTNELLIGVIEKDDLAECAVIMER